MRPLPHYPRGSVRALVTTAFVSAPTRVALEARLAQPAVTAPRFFAPEEFAVLAAVCARLTPSTELERELDIAGCIDNRLADGAGNGWRYSALPPDGEAYRRGLKALEAMAQATAPRGFIALDGSAQDALLGSVQRGEVPPALWSGLPPERFFEELLAESAFWFFGHPLAQEDIGYVGMADVPGWTALGLGRLEDREPREVSG